MNFATAHTLLLVATLICILVPISSSSSSALTPHPGPPIGVYCITDCGPDLLINIILTILGCATSTLPLLRAQLIKNSYLPGCLHALYLLYVSHEHRQNVRRGIDFVSDAPGVFSPEAQEGQTVNKMAEVLRG